MTSKSLALVVCLTWWALLSCSSATRGPTRNPQPTACSLPTLPQPFQLKATVRGDVVEIDEASMRAIVAYLADVRAWVRAAQICLQED